MSPKATLGLRSNYFAKEPFHKKFKALRGGCYATKQKANLFVKLEHFCEKLYGAEIPLFHIVLYVFVIKSPLRILIFPKDFFYSAANLQMISIHLSMPSLETSSDTS